MISDARLPSPNSIISVAIAAAIGLTLINAALHFENLASRLSCRGTTQIQHVTPAQTGTTESFANVDLLRVPSKKVVFFESSVSGALPIAMVLCGGPSDDLSDCTITTDGDHLVIKANYLWPATYQRAWGRISKRTGKYEFNSVVRISGKVRKEHDVGKCTFGPTILGIQLNRWGN